jgi:hypothetical protein
MTNEFNILQIVYYYRLEPDALFVPMLLSFAAKERLLYKRETAIPWSGIVGALMERHPDHYPMWRAMHGEMITQSIRVEKHWQSHTNPLWADHITNRWVILARDEEAWRLLLLAHHTDKVRASAAQRCIEKICMGVELLDRNGMARVDSQGITMGVLGFPDLRQQILELTEEFRAMTPVQRTFPFSRLPFSREFQLKRHEQRAQFAALASSSLID